MSTSSSSSNPGALRGRVVRAREELAAHLGRSGEDGVFAGRAHARWLDALVRDLYAAAIARLGAAAPEAALAAVGSYGRGAVALRSDADVRLVVRSAKHREQASALAEAMLYPLWDAGVSVGHQVVDIGEALALAQDDLATATSLLDLRFVAGDPAILRELLDRAWSGIFDEGAIGAFVQRLEEEAATRHGRFGGSLYLLEPDVKSGAGGQRDLDGARWAARARFKVGGDAAPGDAEPGGGREGARALGFWGELVRLGVLVTREAQEIAGAEEFLWRVRNRLHVHAGRRSDRLTFDEQETIAVEMGYADEGDPERDRDRDRDHDRVGEPASPAEMTPASGRRRAAAAERMMQDYYLYARVVARARERILVRATPQKRRAFSTGTDLGRGVMLFDGQVTIAQSAELASDPALAMRVYAACVRHRVPVLAFARDAIARAAGDPAWCAALRASPEAAAAFVELVCTIAEAPLPKSGRLTGPTSRGSICGELHDVGLLLAMIPEFAPVTGRVHHDVYHVYTVDVHSVAAVDCLRQLARGELAVERPLATRLAAEIARPRPIFLATLLHDVGKGYPDATGSRKNHSRSGAELCDVILPRLGLAPDETAEARALVLQHLAMYHTATRRDLDDPATIEDTMRTVRGREGLRDLYLLTVADITTTSPTAMTSWKARMLDELYFAADARLAEEEAAGAAGKRAAPGQTSPPSGSHPSAFDEARLSRVRAAAFAKWLGPRDYLEQFLASMPERYLLANAPEAIVAHAGAALDRAGATVHAAIVPSRHPEVVELCVVADDRPGLLARIAAAITAGRLEVLAAQVYSRTIPAAAGPGGAGGASGARVEAVDLFWVRDRVDAEGAVERALPRLVRDLTAVVSGEVEPAALLAERVGASPWRERPSPAVQTEVVVDDRASPRHTVVEVFAKDRPGLLYRVARALHDLGLSIVLSKINTEGTRVADVFYVSELDGSKVQVGERFRTIREELTRAIDETGGAASP